jgi:hypothetical protein
MVGGTLPFATFFFSPTRTVTFISHTAILSQMSWHLSNKA